MSKLSKSNIEAFENLVSRYVRNYGDERVSFGNADETIVDIEVEGEPKEVYLELISYEEWEILYLRRFAKAIASKLEVLV